MDFFEAHFPWDSVAALPIAEYKAIKERKSKTLFKKNSIEFIGVALVNKIIGFQCMIL